LASVLAIKIEKMPEKLPKKLTKLDHMICRSLVNFCQWECSLQQKSSNVLASFTAGKIG